MTEIVGVVGATGSVGRVAARELSAAGCHVRVAGRDAAHLASLANECAGMVEPVVLDARDAATLISFAQGCVTVLNCAGPSALLGATVARSVLLAGADYVDVAGETLLVRAVADIDASESCRAVLGAGLTPGLTGILPRMMLSDLDDGARLVGCSGGVDRFSPAGAWDYLAALDTQVNAGAIWRHGKRAAQAERPVRRAQVPYFPRRVGLHPFLSAEVESLASSAGLDEAVWYTAFDGDAVLKALRRPAGADLRVRAADLIAASRLDAAGKQSHQTIVVQITGSVKGSPVIRGAVLRGLSAAELSGGVGAVTALEIIAQNIPPGRYLAAEILNPDAVIERLRQSRILSLCQRWENADVFTAEAEEGVL